MFVTYAKPNPQTRLDQTFRSCVGAGNGSRPSVGRGGERGGGGAFLGNYVVIINVIIKTLRS